MTRERGWGGRGMTAVRGSVTGCGKIWKRNEREKEKRIQCEEKGTEEKRRKKKKKKKKAAKRKKEEDRREKKNRDWRRQKGDLKKTKERRRKKDYVNKKKKKNSRKGTNISPARRDLRLRQRGTLRDHWRADSRMRRGWDHAVLGKDPTGNKPM